MLVAKNFRAIDVINSRKAIAEAVIGLLIFFTTRRGVMVEHIFCRYFLSVFKTGCKTMPNVKTKCLGQTAERIEEQKEESVFFCLYRF